LQKREQNSRHCYWRAGDNDERVFYFNEALKRLTIGGNARANALIGLSFVEWAESRYNEALRILTENAPVFDRITNHTFKGTYHNQLGITLKKSERLQKSALIIFNAQSS
jgi:tetratricopeptide (TPR) repeat protein